MATNPKSYRDQDESQPGSEGPRIKSIPSKYKIRDPHQQILVLEGGILKAVPDKQSKAGSDFQPEIFYVSTCTNHMHKNSTTKGNHIFLAVSKGKLCLCCDKVKEPKHPSLELKNKNINELNSLSCTEQLPFTFLQEKVGSYFTLESAANPGYFIYTSKTPRQPVGMTKEPGKKNNTHFEFQNANVDLNSTQCG